MQHAATSFAEPAPARASRNAAIHTLARDAMMVLRPLAACQIRCHAGVLWVTLDGDGRDFFLHPGESLMCAAHRTVVVEARSVIVRFTTH